MLLEVEKVNIEQLSPAKLLEIDKRNEEEISRIQRGFREICRGPHKNRCNVNYSLFVRILESEIQALDLKLKSALSKVHVQEYEKQLEIVKGHISCQKIMTEEIKTVKRVTKQLTSQLQRIDKEEMKVAKKSINDHEYEILLKKIQKTKEILNSRLYVSKCNEGKLFEENYRLREGIQELLQDRAAFNKHWTNFAASLNFHKRYLIDLIERATLAFNCQQELLHKIDHLNEDDRIDTIIQSCRMEELIREMSSIDKKHDFLGVKGKKRELMPLNEPEVQRRATVEQNLKNSIELYWKIIDKILKTYSKQYQLLVIENKKNETGKIRKKSMDYDDKDYDLTDAERQMLKRIDEESVIDEKFCFLTQTMVEYKLFENNYIQQFNFLNQIQNQLVPLNIFITEKHNQLNLKRLTRKEETTSRLEQGLQLFNALKQEKSKSFDYEKMLASREIELQKYLQQINIIFTFLNCDTTFINSLLGDMSKVNRFNIKLFLSSLEMRVNKILGHIYYCESQAKVPRTVTVQRQTRPIVSIAKYVGVTQCSECAEQQEVNQYDEDVVLPEEKSRIKKNVQQKVKNNDFDYRMHTLSKCRLPKSRILVNKRFS